jgi:hypothetical protein
VTRIDMSTREWHELIKPVLPHVGTDKDFPELAVVRLEIGGDAVYAAATDRYTLAAERWPLPPADRGIGFQVVHLAAKEAAASLKLFSFGKDDDPPLMITIDSGLVSVMVAGTPASVPRLAVTVQQAGDGTRLVLHDERDPTADPLAGWRKNLRAAIGRPTGRPIEGLELQAFSLTRWASAAGKGERLTLFTGPEPGDPLLVTVEDHFAGLASVPQFLEGSAKTLAGLPWHDELAVIDGVDVGTGEVLDGGE